MKGYITEQELSSNLNEKINIISKLIDDLDNVKLNINQINNSNNSLKNIINQIYIGTDDPRQKNINSIVWIDIKNMIIKIFKNNKWNTLGAGYL